MNQEILKGQIQEVITAWKQYKNNFSNHKVVKENEKKLSKLLTDYKFQIVIRDFTIWGNEIDIINNSDKVIAKLLTSLDFKNIVSIKYLF